MSTSVPKPPEILDKIVDLVLSHKPKKRKKPEKKSRSSLPKTTASQERQPKGRH